MSDICILIFMYVGLSDLITSFATAFWYPATGEKQMTLQHEMCFCTNRLHMGALGVSIRAFCINFRCASFSSDRSLGVTKAHFTCTGHYFPQTTSERKLGLGAMLDLWFAVRVRTCFNAFFTCINIVQRFWSPLPANFLSELRDEIR